MLSKEHIDKKSILKHNELILEGTSSNTQFSTESLSDNHIYFQIEPQNNMKSDETDSFSEVIISPDKKKLKTLLKKESIGNGKKIEKKIYNMLRDKKNQALDLNDSNNSIISDVLYDTNKKSYLLSPSSCVNITTGIFFGEDNLQKKKKR